VSGFSRTVIAIVRCDPDHTGPIRHPPSVAITRSLQPLRPLVVMTVIAFGDVPNRFSKNGVP